MCQPVLCAAVLAAALLPATVLVAAPLSLEQAMQQAVERSALTRAARAGALGAGERARAAGQQPDPLLGIGIDNLPATGSRRFDTRAEDMTMKRIGLAQEWISADKRAAREAEAQATAGRESAMEGLAAADTRLQTALAFVDAHYAGRALALALRSEQHAREALAAGRGRLAAAQAGSAEVLERLGALGAAEDASAELRQQQAAAGALLQRWTGLPADAIDTLDTLDALDAPRLPPVPAREDFVARHPAVVVGERELAVARQGVERARLERRPNWSYELSYGQRVGRADLVSFGVSIPLPIAPAARQDRETAATLARVEQAEAGLEEARRAAAGEHAALSIEADRLQQRIERFEAGVLTPLQQRTASVLAAYRANEAGLAMLFEARQAELDAQRKLLMLQRDRDRARAQGAFKPITQGALR